IVYLFLYLYHHFFILPSFSSVLFLFFFFNDTATSEIYTLSLHDALPISTGLFASGPITAILPTDFARGSRLTSFFSSTTLSLARSEEHTSELQSPYDLVCRLLLEKKKKKKKSKKYNIYQSYGNRRKKYVR